ncbi:MAG: ferredoxin:glutaredoxin reductase [Spirochaetes bacterium]|nr:ferredoxin:glutaredoxin reductase [Spirochaetota bacterium]
MTDDAAAEALRRRLSEEAERSGYHLNPDREFTLGLARGLLLNESRYGYQSCPCRLASGNADEDRDIVCPCDYRDPDLAEHGACYCALYVTQAALDGAAKLHKVPERRGGARPSLAAPPSVHPWTMGTGAPRPRAAGPGTAGHTGAPGPTPYPVWRCRVCGYLCARDEPPEVCPVCKARKDRFERFW